jgi:hypothetical protein
MLDFTYSLFFSFCFIQKKKNSQKKMNHNQEANVNPFYYTTQLKIEEINELREQLPWRLKERIDILETKLKSLDE